MNLTDRKELNECRKTMSDMFLKVARTPEDDQEIEEFLTAQDRHQELLSKEAKEG